MNYPDKIYPLPGGRKLSLRVPQPSDAAALLSWLRQVAGETDYLSKGPDEITMTVEEEQAFLQKTAADPGQLMLAAYVDDELAGTVSVRRGGTRRTAHRGTVGIALRREFWGQGLGTLMMEEMDAAGRELDLLFLELTAVEANRRAIALYEKMGYRQTGRLEQATRLPDGSFQTLVTMRKAL